MRAPCSKRCFLTRTFASGFAVLAACLLANGPASAQPSWTNHGVVTSGTQFDVVSNGNDRLYLISDVLTEFDGACSVISTDNSVGDDHHGGLDFPPAIALGPDGAVHVITRHGGDYNSGFDLRYHRRNAAGTWDVDLGVGEKVARNYVVGVAVLDDGRVFFAHSRQVQDVNATISFYELTGGSEVSLGTFSNSGWLRTDADFRMRAAGGRVVLASGSPWPNGTVHFFSAEPGGGLVAALEASHQVHEAGSGRKGMPDLFVDSSERVAFTYGALHEVYFNRYDGSSASLGSDLKLFDGLGDWHLSLGLSAIGATPNGENLLAVALVANGSQTASDSDLLWTYATGSIDSWSTPADTGVNTDGGEGRLRPRIVGAGDLVHVFYRDATQSGVSASTVTFPATGGSGGSAGAAGSAGSGSAGSAGSSGGQGGAAGSGGSSAGGQAGSAGSSSGGASGATGGSVGTPSASEDDDGGCGCRFPSRSNPSPIAWLVLGCAWLLRRRVHQPR